MIDTGNPYKMESKCVRSGVDLIQIVVLLTRFRIIARLFSLFLDPLLNPDWTDDSGLRFVRRTFSERNGMGCLWSRGFRKRDAELVHYLTVATYLRQ